MGFWNALIGFWLLHFVRTRWGRWALRDITAGDRAPQLRTAC